MENIKLNIYTFADTSVEVEINLKSNLSGINEATSALEHFQDFVKEINNTKLNVSFDLSNVMKQSQNLSNTLTTRLGNIKVPDVTSKLFDTRKVDVSKMTNDLIKAPTVFGMTMEAIQSKYNDPFAGISRSSQTLEKNVENADKKVKQLGQTTVNSTSMMSKGFKTMLASLGISASIAGVTKAIKSAVTAAASYEEARNLFVMAVGDYADENFDWAKKISTALYLDDSEILQYTGSFFNLTKGLGAASDAANLMAKNLTQLTYDMSSYLNIDVSVANTKLMSAMSGQTKAVTSVGIAVQQASLQELAYSLGVKKSVASMTQAEKTYLRYIQIMRSTKQMQGDLGRTIITPTNAFRMLATQVTLLGRAIGQMLTPVIYKLMPMLIALTRVLTQAATKIAEFLGYKMQDIDYSGVDGLTDSIKDLGKEVDKTAAKVNRMLAPFDQLNVVESKGGGGGGTTDNVLDKLGEYLTGYDMLEGLNEKMADSISEWEERIKTFGKVALGVVASIAALKLLEKIAELTNGVRKLTGGDAGGALLTLLRNVGEAGSIGGGAMKTFADHIGLTGTAIKNAIPMITPFIEVLAGIPLTIDGMVRANKAGMEIASADTQAFGDHLISLGETVGGFALISQGVLGTTIPGLLVGLIAYSAQLEQGMNAEFERIAIEDLNTRMGSLTISTQNWLNTLTTSGGSLGEIVRKLEAYEESLHKNNETVDTYVQTALGDFALYQTGVGQYAIISKDMYDTVTKDMENITTTSSTGIKTYLEQQLTWMQDNYENADAEGKKFWKSQMDDIAKNATDSETKIKNSRNEILKIYQRAYSQHRNLNDTEYAEIQRHLNTINTEYDRFTTGVVDTLGGMFDEAGDLQNGYSVESLKNFIEAKNKYLEEVKTKADEEYEYMKKHYDRQKTSGKINQEEYDKLIEEANTARERKISKSKEVVSGYLSGIQKQVIDTYTELLKDTEHNTDEQQKILEGLFDDLDIDPTKYFDQMTVITNDGMKILESNKGNYKSLGEGNADSYFSGWQKRLEEKFKKTKFTIKTDVDVSSDGKKINLTTKDVKTVELRAAGGFVGAGDMFIANEAGPEFITKVGNKSAVINQDQMARGVAQAVVEVAKSMNGGGQPTTVIVNLGDEKLYEGQGSYQSRQTDRYGTTVVNI